MDAPSLEAKAVRFPPGRVKVRLSEEHRLAYKRLYARYGSVLAGLPVLRDRDFDGRAVLMTRAEFEALDRAISGANGHEAGPHDAFAAQERGRRRLFKRMQYLS